SVRHLPLDDLRAPARPARAAAATPGSAGRLGTDDRPGSGPGWPRPGLARWRLDLSVLSRGGRAEYAGPRAERSVRVLPRPLLARGPPADWRIPDTDRDWRPISTCRGRRDGLRPAEAAARRGRRGG